MALVDEVQTRYSTQFLANLTNPDSQGSTSIDSTRLAAAAADVEADFKIHAAVAYDNSDARHVAVAVRGVEIRLGLYTGKKGWRESFTGWLLDVKALGLVTGRAKIIPKSTSALTPADETPSGEEKRPAFDYNEHFDDYAAKPPGG